MKLYEFGIKELSSKLKNKEVSSLEITNEFLDRIEKEDTSINSYITVAADYARKAAAGVDERIASGDMLSKLAGVPMNLKDNICTEGILTTCASKILSNFVSPYDATVWSKIKSNGGILLGKANMDEFAMGASTETSYFKTTRNPYDLSRVPGGSSGGGAASVAADLAVYSIGTDTGGSIRQPASFCGIVGIKPTYGRVSRYGIIAYASSLDQAGILAKSVSDAAVVLGEISGNDLHDSTTSDMNESFESALITDVKGLKIGVPVEYFASGIDHEVKTAILSALKKYEEMGAIVEEFSSDMAEFAIPAYYIIACAEASSNLAMFDGVRYGLRAEKFDDLDGLYKESRSEGFGDEVKRRIMLGTYALSSGYYNEYYNKALKVRTKVSENFKSAFQKYDVLITPVAPTTAYELGKKTSPVQLYMADICTASPNLAGLPAMSVPCGMDSNNMPIGMQILAKPFNEKAILRAGYAFEQATSFKDIKPLR